MRRVEEVAEVLRREVTERHAGGDRLESIADLAARLGTSKNTVLAALNALACEGLVDRRPGCGVFVRERPADRNVVGILVEHDILHPRCSVFWTQLVRELRMYLAAREFTTRLYLGEAPFGEPAPERVSSAHFLEDLADGRLGAVLLVCTRMSPPLRTALAAAGVPVVGDTPEVPHRVLIRPNAMVREGVAQLAAQGCRRIALMTWNTAGLVDAFRRAMEAAGLPVDPAWVREDLLPESGGAGWEEFREIWFARETRPDGLLIMDDILGRDALAAIRELGIDVPGRLRIVAHATRGAEIPWPDSVVLLERDPAEAAAAMGATTVRLLSRRGALPPGGGGLTGEDGALAFRIVPARRPAPALREAAR